MPKDTRKRAPKFTAKMLSGDDTLAELGVTEESAVIPSEWKRQSAAPKREDAETTLGRLFSRKATAGALKQALRRIAERAAK